MWEITAVLCYHRTDCVYLLNLASMHDRTFAVTGGSRLCVRVDVYTQLY
jgi:hypothetical protein